jgi:peptidoglycan-associated lipoprotein
MNTKTYLLTLFGIALFTLGCFLSLQVTSISYAEAGKGYPQTDLSEINHPELFTWKWLKSVKQDSNELTHGADIQPTPVPTIGIERPKHNTPIPLNELDSSLVQRVHFDYDKDLLLPDAKTGIQINAAWIKMHTEYDILLEGHCDERGSNEYNIALGDRRAQSVREYMIRQGINPERIITRSFGEEKPLDLRQTNEAFALNRRVEFYAIP